MHGGCWKDQFFNLRVILFSLVWVFSQMGIGFLAGDGLMATAR
jgi:hypothetical protein